MTGITLTAPSPSPTGEPVGVKAVGSPTFWIVPACLIAFFALVRAVNRLLGWGSRGRS